ncbi:hypothetical protein, partial [Leuconostoc mesenteroides]|uniref:hypothetical protein n=1 Tax=Leuconostoc mesenteroides TaxID=1245 RepID=UPI0038882BB0
QTLDRSFSRPSPYPYKLWFYPLALINYLVIEPIKKRPYWRCIIIFILLSRYNLNTSSVSVDTVLPAEPLMVALTLLHAQYGLFV